MPNLVELLETAAKSDEAHIKSALDPSLNWSAAELHTKAAGAAQLFRRSQVKPQDRVAIISDNTPGFLVADYGVLMSGASSVLINQKLNPPELLRLYFEATKPKAVIAQEANIDQVKKATDVPVIPLEGLLELSAVPTLFPSYIIDPRQEAAVIFSSGSSSKSDRDFKAVSLTHNNIATNVLAGITITDMVQNPVYISGLAPQWHSFEYMVQKAMISSGGTLHFTNRAGFQKRGHGKLISPHYAIMIPKVANLLMKKIKDGIKEKGSFQEDLFEKALLKSIDHNNRVLSGEASAMIAQTARRLVEGAKDKVLYQRVRKQLEPMLGSNISCLLGGSAPLARATQEFFYAIGLPIYQGYGLTETSPVVSANTPEHYRMGSSGRVIPGVEVTIVDPETMRPLPPGKKGIILVEGENVFKEYVDEPELTEEAFHDGKFNTGDIGYIEEVDDDEPFGPFLYITGREKRIIVLEGGEKCNPEPIESRYENTDYISRLILVGNGKPYVGALVVPQDDIKKKISDKDLTIDGLTQIVLKELDSETTVSGKIKHIGIDLEFDESRFTTQTQKLRFNLYEQERREQIDALYAHRN